MDAHVYLYVYILIRKLMFCVHIRKNKIGSLSNLPSGLRYIKPKSKTKRLERITLHKHLFAEANHVDPLLVEGQIQENLTGKQSKGQVLAMVTG